MALDPNTDASVGWVSPEFTRGMTWLDVGSYGLRQFSGWVREEFLTDLVGREGARVFREMADNNATIGSIIFAIQQAIRKVEWRIKPASDKAAAKREAEFVEQVIGDMSHTWEDFITEVLSMLIYGYSFHEIVYKRRLGRRPESRPGPKSSKNIASSKFDDGRIGWRRLPIRGQDTIIKWFFDENGQTQGVTQQPWVGMIVDMPIEKGLLFRPVAHKNNPEGRSILRNSYRSYFFTKRLEEQEAIMAERFNGFPVLYLPSELIDAALAVGSGGGAANPTALQAYNQYKRLVTNIRIDEQMGAILPSDPYIDPSTGKPTGMRRYEFQLVTPGTGMRGAAMHSPAIERYKLDMMMTVLADFIHLGHEVRGTNNLGSIKVDMFYSAIQGWTKGGIASVMNMYALPRLWRMNNLDPDLMPEFEPDLPARIDLDGLGAFVANIANAGMPLFPDEELQNFLRDAAGMPEDEGTAQLPDQPKSTDADSVKKYIAKKVLKRIADNRGVECPTT